MSSSSSTDRIPAPAPVATQLAHAFALLAAEVPSIHMEIAARLGTVRVRLAVDDEVFDVANIERVPRVIDAVDDASVTIATTQAVVRDVLAGRRTMAEVVRADALRAAVRSAISWRCSPRSRPSSMARSGAMRCQRSSTNSKRKGSRDGEHPEPGSRGSREEAGCEEAARQEKVAAKRVTKKQPAKKKATAKRVTKKQPAKKAAKRKAVRRPSEPVDPKPRPGVTTPASRPGGPPTVAVFGAGIAGLTAAHELAERGFAVTVYEARGRRATPATGPARPPPVRLGGMAATQYVAGSDVRRFPDKIGSPTRPPGLIAGEHGFRFFPAYYLHIWDTLRRIPIYDAAGRPTTRTVYDNVERVIAQAGTAPGGQSLVIPREAPRSISEARGLVQEMLQIGYTPTDLSTFFGRFARGTSRHHHSAVRKSSRRSRATTISSATTPRLMSISSTTARRSISSCTTCRASLPPSTPGAVTHART